MIWLADFHVTKPDRTMLTPSTLPISLVHPMEGIGERRSFGGREQRQISPDWSERVRNAVGAVVVVSLGGARLVGAGSALHAVPPAPHMRQAGARGRRRRKGAPAGPASHGHGGLEDAP